MKKSHLIQALRSFSKKEIRDFRKWVQSPMHNQREDVVKLLEYLTTNDCLENDEKLDKELIFKYLFPKEKYDDAKIRQTMYFFSECIDAFLIYQKFLEDEGRQQGFLSVAYRQKGLDKAFNKTINAFIEKKKNQPCTADNLIWRIMKYNENYLILKANMSVRNTRILKRCKPLWIIFTWRISCKWLAKPCIMAKYSKSIMTFVF